jgi:hypothetical protein
MENDEVAMLRDLTERRQILDRLITAHRGPKFSGSRHDGMTANGTKQTCERHPPSHSASSS